MHCVFTTQRQIIFFLITLNLIGLVGKWALYVPFSSSVLLVTGWHECSISCSYQHPELHEVQRRPQYLLSAHGFLMMKEKKKRPLEMPGLPQTGYCNLIFGFLLSKIMLCFWPVVSKHKHLSQCGQSVNLTFRLNVSSFIWLTCLKHSLKEKEWWF